MYMKKHFKRTFDCLELSAESRKQICAALDAYMENPEEMPPRLKKRPGRIHLPLIAAILVIAASLTGFAFGEKVFPLLGGGKIMQYINENGEDVVSVDTGFAVDPVSIWNDRIYFTLDGSYTDITEFCSDTACYSYESSEPDGSLHIVLVGGTPEHVGWAEFTILPSGELFSNATCDSAEEPEWLINERNAIEAAYGHGRSQK